MKTYGDGLIDEAVSAFRQGYNFLGSSMPLESVLLAISGAETKEDIVDFNERIRDISDSLRTDFKINGRNGDIQKTAFNLLLHMQQRKLRKRKKMFKLTDAIMAYEHPDPRVCIGSCLGLTAFYSVVGRRLGLDLNLLTENKHVLARVSYFGSDIPVDLTIDKAFLKDPIAKLTYYNKRRYYGGEQMLPDEQQVEDFFKNRFDLLALRYLIPQFMNSRGVERLNLGDQDGAMCDFVTASLMDPKYAATHVNIGSIHFANKRRDLAESEFKQALKLNPRNEVIHTNLGAVYLLRGIQLKDMGDGSESALEFNKAEEYFDSALRLDAFSSEAYYYKWLLHDNMGDQDGARENYKFFQRYKQSDPCDHDENKLPPFPTRYSKKKVKLKISDLCLKDKAREFSHTLSGAKEFIVTHTPPALYSVAKFLKNSCCGHKH